MRWIHALLIVGVAAFFTHTPVASAQDEIPPIMPGNPKKQASALYKVANHEARDGMTKVTRGRQLLDSALAKYRAARALYASFKIDLNIGGVLAAMGRRTESAKYHEIFLLKMPKTVPPAIVEQAKNKLWELRKELSSVRLETDLQGMQIQINGEDVDVTPQKYPHYVEPGKYVMILSKEGYVSDTRRLVLR